MESSLVHYPVAISHGLRMLQNPSESTFEAKTAGTRNLDSWSFSSCAYLGNEAQGNPTTF